MSNPIIRFRDLAIGTEFDFIDDSRPGYNSFFKRVRKISSRQYMDASVPFVKYQYSAADIYKVGSINAQVFHVGEVAK